MATDIYGIDEISESQSNKYVTHNAAVRVLEALSSGAKSRSNSGPPGSPAAGDVYIVDSATGAWSTAAADDIAHYYASSWHFTTPVAGTLIWVEDEDALLRHDGSDWASAVADQAAALLGTATLGMQTADGAQTIYTVPTGKKMIPHSVVLRNPTGSLAGATDINLGDGANRDTWKANIDVSGMTATTDCMVITSDNTKFTVFDAADTFGMKPDTGSTGDYNAVFSLFGYLFDA